MIQFITMDPGTALGVVSLGIQVCQAIGWYYNEWKDCAQEVRHAIQSVENLQKTLSTFPCILADDQIDRNVKSSVKECVQACGDGIKQLDLERKKFENPSKVKQGLSRGLYPFRGSTLAKLKELVGDLLGQLTLALQVLDISENGRVHASTREAVTQARADIFAIANSLDIVNEAVERIEISHESIAKHLMSFEDQNATL